MRIRSFPVSSEGAFGRLLRRLAVWRHAALNRTLSALYERPMEMMPHSAVVPAVGVVLWVMRDHTPHIVCVRRRQSGSTAMGIPVASYNVMYFEREERLKSLLVGTFGRVFAKTLPLNLLTLDRLAALQHVFVDDEALGFLSCDVALWVVGIQAVQLDLVVLPPETDMVLIPLADILRNPREVRINPVSAECVSAVKRHLPKLYADREPREDHDDIVDVPHKARGRVLN